MQNLERSYPIRCDMLYECITHVHGSTYILEHRIDGKKVLIKGQEVVNSFNGHPFVPNDHGSWTSFQISELILLDLLIYSE